MKTKPFKYLVISFFFISFLSCKNKEAGQTITFFGGQIINPKSQKVYVYKDDELIDSSKLTNNNKFLIVLDSIDKGLFTFMHGPEVQYMYLEPQDSLLIRLNTWDFDESLVFSGKGAERNNFLINIFLENEKENKLFFDYYHLNDSLFELKIDSLLQLKNLLYSHFKEEVTTNSVVFDKLVHAAIYYPLYRKKEAYPYRHRKANNSAKYPNIDPTFYKFRKDININDKDLAHFYAHQDYVQTYLYHLAYEKQVIEEFKSPMEINFMKVALENVTNDKVKNKFLHEGMWLTLLDDKTNKEQKEDAQRLFFDHCSDEKSVSEIGRLITASEMSPKGYKLPNIKVFDFNDKDASLNALIKGKNAIIYTWPKGARQIDNLAKRVAYLENKYPDYLFLGINSKNATYKWKKYITSKKMNADNQYRAEIVNGWLDVNFSRAILVNKNGIVQNNMTHLSSRGFESQLRALQ